VGKYVTRRLISGAGVMAVLLVLVFFTAYVIGDPISLQRNPDFFDEATLEAMAEQLGYRRPMWEQFADYLGGVVTGDFGISVTQSRPALDVVLDRLPATLLLTSVAIVIVVSCSVPLALIAARANGGWPDQVITSVSTALASMPSFWVAIALIFVFSVELRWLPTGGYGGYGGWRELILPSVALSALPLGHATLVLNSAMRSEFSQYYVTVARAKGLRESSVAYRHVLRNAALVLATQLGFLIIGLTNGAVLVETVFAWPGLGLTGLQAVQQRDLPVITAVVVLTGSLVTFVNIAVDLAYAQLDPRVRLS